MSRPGPARRVGLGLQLGQTLSVIGAAVLAVGLLLRDNRSAVVVGAVLLVVGLVVVVVGLRTQRRGTPD